MAEILIARLLAGVFTGGVFVCSLAYVANTTPEEKRGQYLTIYATGQSVFNAFGYFVGGMLGEFGVWYAFLAQAICLLVSGVGFFVFCLPDADPAAGRPQLGTLVRECNPFAAFAAGKTFLNLTWVKLLGLCCFSYVGYNAFEQVFNYYIKDQFGLTSSYNGTIKFAVGAHLADRELHHLHLDDPQHQHSPDHPAGAGAVHPRDPRRHRGARAALLHGDCRRLLCLLFHLGPRSPRIWWRIMPAPAKTAA